MERKTVLEVEAERSVLGAALLDASVFPAARLILDPEDFGRAAHGLMWAAMARMCDEGTAIDQLTLKRFLESRGALERAGGAAYILDLAGSTFALANWPDHARIVKTASVLNALEEIAVKTDACVARREDPAKVIERVLEKTAVASQQLQRARRPIPAATSCKGCGASVPAGSRYCPQCGVRLDA